MEKLIGYSVVGLTLLMAAMDGALALLALAALLGGGTYLFLGGVGNTPGLLSRPQQIIFDREKRRIQEILDNATKEERAELKKEVQAKLEQLQKTQKFNIVWDKKIAGILGLSVFASPIVSLGLLGYVFTQARNSKVRNTTC